MNSRLQDKWLERREGLYCTTTLGNKENALKRTNIGLSYGEKNKDDIVQTSSISRRLSASVVGTGLSQAELRLRLLSSLHRRAEHNHSIIIRNFMLVI